VPDPGLRLFTGTRVGARERQEKPVTMRLPFFYGWDHSFAVEVSSPWRSGHVQSPHRRFRLSFRRSSTSFGMEAARIHPPAPSPLDLWFPGAGGASPLMAA